MLLMQSTLKKNAHWRHYFLMLLLTCLTRLMRSIDKNPYQSLEIVYVRLAFRLQKNQQWFKTNLLKRSLTVLIPLHPAMSLPDEG